MHILLTVVIHEEECGIASCLMFKKGQQLDIGNLRLLFLTLLLVRYSLLIEDSHGTMCQIFCPEDADTRFPSVLQRGEGLIHVFGGIIVQCRATRDR